MVSPALPLVLGSASPARLETLRRAGVAPYVLVSDVDEDAVVAQARSQYGELAPEDVALVLARAKCEAVAARLAGAEAPDDAPVGALVLGCDSVLELDEEVHGKPVDAAEALARWQRMRGRSGVLHTGHWVIDDRDEGGTGATLGAVASTTVHFATLSDAEIEAYVATGEPLRVAGAFTLDGLGGPYVERIEGDPHNVVGISLPLLREMLASLDVLVVRADAAEPPWPPGLYRHTRACHLAAPVSRASSTRVVAVGRRGYLSRVMANPTGVRAPHLPAASPAAHDREQAEGYVAMVCFKHGPPRLHGVELERTLHDVEHPTRPVDIARLRAALGDHTPATVDPASPHTPLTHGSLVTVEPGGQVEISTPPHAALDTVIEHTRADSAQLVGLLQAPRASPSAATGSTRTALLAASSPRPRYTAMEQAYVPIGPGGAQMMCSSASLQVCLDAGEATGHPLPLGRARTRSAPRWSRCSPTPAATPAPDTRWASARLRSVLGTCPPVTLPPAALGDDPARGWARLADGGAGHLPAPRRRARGPRRRGCPSRPGSRPAPAVSLPVPTTDDLDYHLSTMFPPVRPRGYLEIRYLDAQPGDAWVHPFVLLCALLSSAPRCRRGRWRPPNPPGTGGSRPAGTACRTRGSAPPQPRSSRSAARPSPTSTWPLRPGSAVLDRLPQLVSTPTRRCSA